MDEYQWIGGSMAIEAVLQANSREVAEILVRQDRFDGSAARIQQLGYSAGIQVSRVSRETIAGHAPGETPETIIARVGPKRMVDLVELLATKQAAVVMLDGVEDPFNFGQAVRSLYAAGIDGLIVRPRNWLTAAATVVRSSAGASEWMPMAVAEADEALAAARGSAMSVVVAVAENATSMYQVDLSGSLLLVIGGEKRGVARALEQAADRRVAIPYGRDVAYSLGTAAAATILGFEIMRQRQGGAKSVSHSG